MESFFPVDIGIDEEVPVFAVVVFVVTLSDSSSLSLIVLGSGVVNELFVESDWSDRSLPSDGEIDFKVVGMDSVDERRSFALEKASSKDPKLDALMILDAELLDAELLDAELLVEFRLPCIDCL